MEGLLRNPTRKMKEPATSTNSLH